MNIRGLTASLILVSLVGIGAARADQNGMIGGAVAGGIGGAVVGGPVGLVVGGVGGAVVGNAMTNHHHRYRHYAYHHNHGGAY